MSKKKKDIQCFGFFAGYDNSSCYGCTAAKRCKAVLVSHSFDILADTIQHLVEELQDVPYKNTDRVSDLVDQLKSPPSIPKEAQDLLTLAAGDRELSDILDF